MTVYSTCVGHFKEASESKKALKKLNELGLKGFLFSMNDFYTLKTYTGPNENIANNLMKTLKIKGFDTFVVSQNSITK